MKKLKKKYERATTNVFPTVDVVEFLTSKGIEFKQSENNPWLKMRCLMPDHDDKTPSFFIHKIHGGYNCYGCKATGNWGELCEIMNWDIKNDNVTLDTVHDSLWKDSIDGIKKSDIVNEIIVAKKPEGLELLDFENKKHKDFLKYINDRNIDVKEFCDKFKLFCTFTYDDLYRKKYFHRLIIPVYDEWGKYLWMEGRTILKIKKEKYWRPSTVRKQLTLYNLNRVLKAGFDYVIVVEGIIDAMLLWLWGLPGVCCFGSVISDDQILLLMKFYEIILCLDNDEAGIKGFVKSKDKFSGTGTTISRVIMPKKKDVNVIGEKQFRYLLTKRRDII